jgi:hypothetical protein
MMGGRQLMMGSKGGYDDDNGYDYEPEPEEPLGYEQCQYVCSYFCPLPPDIEPPGPPPCDGDDCYDGGKGKGGSKGKGGGKGGKGTCGLR